MLIKDADIVGYGNWLRFIWKAHITNWIWRDRQKRRLTRQKYYGEMKDTFFKKYLPFVESLTAKNDIPSDYKYEEEKLFSLWFQSEENAPLVVKACLESIRKIYGKQFVILNEKTMMDYVSLPDYIMEKWQRKKIKAANFSDIVRIDLLTRHGGYWFDATDYLLSPIPEIIRTADFFMYVTSPVLYTHMFVQTCFMRAKKGDPLIRMWRDLIFEYWRREDMAADYFYAHMLFKLLVTHNAEAKRLFERMPKLYQDRLQDLWYTYGHMPDDTALIDKMKNDTFFQKCSYRKLKHAVNEIKPGTLADRLINGIFKEKE